MPTVVEINDPQALVSYRLLWDYLLPQTPGVSSVDTFDWQEKYWQNVGAKQKLRLLIIHSCGKPIGIVPFCIRLQSSLLRSSRILTYPGYASSSCGPVGADQAAIMMVALRHIKESPRDWDRIELPGFRSGPERTRHAMRIVGL